jgi:hypothetical protein
MKPKVMPRAQKNSSQRLKEFLEWLHGIEKDVRDAYPEVKRRHDALLAHHGIADVAPSGGASSSSSSVSISAGSRCNDGADPGGGPSGAGSGMSSSDHSTGDGGAMSPCVLPTGDDGGAMSSSDHWTGDGAGMSPCDLSTGACGAMSPCVLPTVDDGGAMSSSDLSTASSPRDFGQPPAPGGAMPLDLCLLGSDFDPDWWTSLLSLPGFDDELPSIDDRPEW